MPPAHEDVPREVDDMCDHVNASNESPIHLCAYLMWKINWIHPFVDGNGRTTRAISYIILCQRLGFALPGANTIPDQISLDKSEYYSCLDAADAAWRQGKNRRFKNGITD